MATAAAPAVGGLLAGASAFANGSTKQFPLVVSKEAASTAVAQHQQVLDVFETVRSF